MTLTAIRTKNTMTLLTRKSVEGMLGEISLSMMPFMLETQQPRRAVRLATTLPVFIALAAWTPGCKLQL